MLRFARMQRVFVTGGTGFVGRAVIRALLGQGFLVRCLVRRGSEQDLRGFEAIDRVPGDVLEPDPLIPCVEGSSALIHLVGIIREHPARGVTFRRLHVEATRNMLRVAEAARVPRVVHMSALGARAGAPSMYHRTKWAAEEAVRASGLASTIFRPSLIYGPGDGFISMLAGQIRRLPVVPVLGDGRYRLQPVPVEQVAEAFARALRLEETVGKAYEAAGPEAHSYVEILDKVGAALGRRRVRKAYAPMGLVKGLTRYLQHLPFFPLTMDQLLMLEEGSVADPGPFFDTFRIAPEKLDEGLERMFAATR
ncbi:MAG: complex I NDUFA9 subunit family protein [Candidatus Rokubacteria bacterium]|nr:complex I NDUFA9 subunit family protein [Candidatus Rokubacteria bacterium]